VIEDRSFGRLGGTEVITVDARLVALSREPLGDLVRGGTFREDLFFRLNVIPVRLPPLRERTDDIIPLAEHFLHSFREKYGKPQLKVERLAFDELAAYAFPGNVRELRNLVDRLVMLSEGDTITSEQLPDGVRHQKAGLKPNSDRPTLEQLERQYIAEILEFTRGKKGKAAAILGISRKTLLEKRKRYGLIE
jgi:DNA-binding NtrC family response regulator